jgi:hypothetical protein
MAFPKRQAQQNPCEAIDTITGFPGRSRLCFFSQSKQKKTHEQAGLMF